MFRRILPSILSIVLAVASNAHHPLSPRQVWFQNRRAKWKKRKKTSGVFRSPGALLPSHSLPPFGSVGAAAAAAEAAAGLASFGSADGGAPPRWAPHAAMQQMGHLGPALARQPPLGPPSSMPAIAQVSRG
ncbi:hypothetical protein HPB47_010484 [Ixodes persulcatus]|uniref:Uncharacterized protein n=1 Tax=Ixodes persulcatus TaxID=34615 RepID=A0AC60NYZ4_IXOPE|nr:hypothetical protein HPB47_010484 [Ixodes persulcatus]